PVTCVSLRRLTTAAMQTPTTTDGALVTTIGSLVEAPGAEPLHAVDRHNIARWRDERWEALEQRGGFGIMREASAWYEHLVYERWRDKARTGGLSPAALSFFYHIKGLIPRSVQLNLRRRLI